MEPIVPGCYYHIYNHANGNDKLFYEERNYNYFLDKMKEFLLPVAKIYAYCLMPNHFHILLKIRDEDEIQTLESFPGSKTFPKFETLEKVSTEERVKIIEKRECEVSSYLSKQFSNFFSSHTQAMNRMYSRKGSLFMKNFKRKKIKDENYFIRVVNYIHFNPVVHGFVNRPAEWKYSSYNAAISKTKTSIERDELLDWFDGLANFMYCHLRPMDI